MARDINLNIYEDFGDNSTLQTPAPSDSNDKRSGRVYAFDCEMVYTAWGISLARITMVDIDGELVMDLLVRPEHKVVDYNSRFSGLTKEQLENAKYTFEQVCLTFS